MTTDKHVDCVKVRMYRHGFGDCFLLSFHAEGKRVFSMLVDCGIKYNTKSKQVPIKKVIEDLKLTLTPPGETRPKLDVLVASHEHWDHISSFYKTRRRDHFVDFEVGQVWLAWTEDPKDEEAKEINSRLRDGVAALGFAAEQLQTLQNAGVDERKGHYFGGDASAGREAFNRALDDVLGLYGATSQKAISKSGIKYKRNGKVSTRTESAMKNVISLVKEGGVVKYFSPGTMVDRALLPAGVNVYVLGPPRSSLISKSNPSRGRAHETYLSIDHAGLTSFIDGVLGMAARDEGHVRGDNANPFRDELGIQKGDADKDPYLASTYFAPKQAYRKIEHNWLDIAGQLALQLDGAINNTSLVLAIELADSGKVLLFPGDAQVGSWLSWHDFQWEVGSGSSAKMRTAEDLLKNAVLYKVSHHGSHNATIKDKGLELMTHPELVAMMPEKHDSYSGIPYPPLMQRLGQLCKGRVIVSADANFPAENLLREKPTDLSLSQWESFKEDLVVDTVFVEYTIRS